MAITWLELDEMTSQTPNIPQALIAGAGAVMAVGTDTLTFASVGSGGDHEGAWAFVFTFFEFVDTTGTIPTFPAGTDNIHPSNITMRNMTATSGPTYATATGAGGWIDFGYARGGYRDRNYLSVWGKVVTQDDIVDDDTGFRAETVSTSLSADPPFENGTVISRLVVVTGAKTDTTTQTSVGAISRAFMNEVPETSTGGTGSAADSPDKIVFPKGTPYEGYGEDFLGSSFMSIWAGATPRASANIALGGTSESATNASPATTTGSMTAQDGGSDPGPSATTYSSGLTCPAPNGAFSGSDQDDYNLWYPFPVALVRQGSSTTYGGFVNNNRSSMSSVLFFKNFTAFTDFNDPWDATDKAYAFDVASDTMYGSVSGVVLLPEQTGTENDSAVADSATATDEAVPDRPVATKDADPEDSATATDEAALDRPAATKDATAEDSATATDEAALERPVATKDATAQDTATATDEAALDRPAATKDATAQDSATATDTATPARLPATNDVASEDSATATDEAVAETPTAEKSATAEDSATATDEVALERPVATKDVASEDSATATDEAVAETPTAEKSATAQDSAIASDTAVAESPVATNDVASEDSATATDTATGTRAAARSPQDSATATDEVALERPVATKDLLVLDHIQSLGTVEATSPTQANDVTSEDSATATDEAVVEASASVAPQDSATATDEAVAESPLTANDATSEDSATATDEAVLDRPAATKDATAQDSATATDEATAEGRKDAVAQDSALATFTVQTERLPRETLVWHAGLFDVVVATFTVETERPARHYFALINGVFDVDSAVATDEAVATHQASESASVLDSAVASDAVETFRPPIETSSHPDKSTASAYDLVEATRAAAGVATAEDSATATDAAVATREAGFPQSLDEATASDEVETERSASNVGDVFWPGWVDPDTFEFEYYIASDFVEADRGVVNDVEVLGHDSGAVPEARSTGFAWRSLKHHFPTLPFPQEPVVASDEAEAIKGEGRFIEEAEALDTATATSDPFALREEIPRDIFPGEFEVAATASDEVAATKVSEYNPFPSGSVTASDTTEAERLPIEYASSPGGAAELVTASDEVALERLAATKDATAQDSATATDEVALDRPVATKAADAGPDIAIASAEGLAETQAAKSAAVAESATATDEVALERPVATKAADAEDSVTATDEVALESPVATKDAVAQDSATATDPFPSISRDTTPRPATVQDSATATDLAAVDTSLNLIIVHSAMVPTISAVETTYPISVAITGDAVVPHPVAVGLTGGASVTGSITQEIVANVTGDSDIVVEMDVLIGAAGAGAGVADGAAGGEGGPVLLVDILVPMTGGTSGDTTGTVYDAQVTLDGVGSAAGQFNWLLLDEAVTIDGVGSVSPEFLTDGELLSVSEVWNTALTVLGVTTVTQGDGSSQEALLQAIWDGGFRVKFLADHAWNGSKRTKELVEFVANPTGNRWSHAYSLPSDYVRAFRINGKELQPNSHNYGSSGTWGGHDIYEIEVVENSSGTLERCLLTDEGTVMLEYMFDVGDANITLLSPMTRWAMGMALAAHAAPNFGKSQQDIAMLQERADKALLDAKGVDGQEGTPQIFQTTPILDSRY